MDSPFVQMEEEVNYEYHLSAMIGRHRRSLWDGELYQENLCPSVRFCCIYFPFCTAWF